MSLWYQFYKTQTSFSLSQVAEKHRLNGALIDWDLLIELQSGYSNLNTVEPRYLELAYFE